MAGESSGIVKRRTGCRQCKIKRLKCDEVVPACTNCVRRGWQCPGYGKNIRWSAKHERFGPLSATTQRESPSGGSPVNQAPQQQFHRDWHPSGLDQSWIPLDTGVSALDAVQSQYAVSSSPPHLPLTPISQCAIDDSIVMHNEDLRTDPGALVPTPSYKDDGRNTMCISMSHDLVNRLDSTTQHHSRGQETLVDPRIFYTPTHIPTILIEHWFSDVCPMWNIFDSDSNFNRQFASASWSSSEPVFYAMQSMSAACLVDTLPAMMPVVSSLTAKALAAIRSRVCFYQNDQHTAMPEFPTDLLFAIFAMGTSLHWKHGFELGSTLMKHAHCVIDRYRRRLPAMTSSERKHLAFFQKALICWEGILSAADSHFTPTSFAARRSAYQARLASSQFQPIIQQPTFGPPALSLGDIELHPWCGVSSDVLQKFGQVMTLCHIAQRRRSNAVEDGELETSCDLGLAYELATELLAMDFGNDHHQGGMEGQYLGTNDSDTPLSHLLDIAEAYRQACLLQLSLTFEDLPIPTAAQPISGGLSPGNVDCVVAHGITRAQGLVGLSLQLVDQLKKIPPESGSRCMQPLLYLCAASGLQLNPLPPVEPEPLHCQAVRSTIRCDHDVIFREPHDHTWFGDDLGNGLNAVRHSLMPLASRSTANTPKNFDTRFELTVSVFKVAKARSFVKKRLGMLQQLLPPRYTGTALRLAEAIWAEYDCTSSGGSPLYWFDVMVREKLQTFFG